MFFDFVGSKKRIYIEIKIITNSVRLVASADPNGQFLTSRYCAVITFPIIRLSGPPRNSGIIKFPRVGMKVKTIPATIPGTQYGNVIFQNVCRGLAPRSREASRSEKSIRSREEKIGKIMNGKFQYTNPTYIPNELFMSLSGSSIIPVLRSIELIMPDFPRRLMREYIMTRKLVQNGRMIRNIISIVIRRVANAMK